MGEFDALPDGWVVWSDEADGRSVLAFRPDVFDADEFPPPCLPTIYLAHGSLTRRPGANPNDAIVDDSWYVTLSLEPEVRMPDERAFETRNGAVERAIELASAFAAGQLEYRRWYQVPRERYLDRLDELTGRES